ncbi:MAG: XisH family protein [Microcystaceae cyanobacterium]
MPAKDIYHDAVKNALIKEGWTITADPYTIKYDNDHLYADLLAEKTLSSEQQEQIIVVEIKSFVNPSPIKDFQNALGQYLLYREFLEFLDKDYELYLAIRDAVFNIFFQKKSIQAIIKRHQVNLIIFNAKKEEITLWKKS